MHVGAFMVPADKVATCSPVDTVQSVLTTMLEERIGAVVVIIRGTHKVPIGIITKSDLLIAYAAKIAMTCAAKDIMTTDLETIDENMSRDQAARVLQRNRNHHAIVIDKNKSFKGLISAWDIVVECAKDDKAWPWNRAPDGKFHKPNEHLDHDPLHSPTATISTSDQRPGFGKTEMGDSFRAYIDNLGYFD